MTGLEFHLSWSLFQLIGVLLVWAVWVWYGFTKVEAIGLKAKLATAALGAAVILLGAFDTGSRQADLNRSAFNAEQPVVADKVEVAPAHSYWRTLSEMEQRREEIKNQQEEK